MPAVSSSPYESLVSLATVMTLVAPESLSRAAAEVGFEAAESHIIELKSGKRFCVQNFTKATAGWNKTAGRGVLPR